MKYCVKKEKNSRSEKIAELRSNIILVHNKYNKNKINDTGNYSLNLEQFCKDNKEVFNLFFDLAMEVEGFMEALEGAPDNVFDEEVKLLAKRIENAMKEV